MCNIVVLVLLFTEAEAKRFPRGRGPSPRIGPRWEFEMFKSAYVINKNNGVNTYCNANAAQRIASILDGLTEVGYILHTNEIACTEFYLDGSLIAARQAGEMWGPELTAIIEAN